MDLILAFEKRRIRLTSDSVGIEELRRYGRKVKGNSVDYSALNGNDDTVTARALALHIIRKGSIFL